MATQSVTRYQLGNLEAEIRGFDSARLWVLHGQIDELADLERLLAEEAPVGRITIDLAGIQRINSVGVRNWVRFLREAAKRGIEVRIVRCSEPVLLQMNMLVAARAPIESFLAPYECARCGKQQTVCIEVTTMHAAELQAGLMPKPACPACGGAMELDDVPERYAGFLLEGRL
jgi:ABC-type transporter Mla MlaB component